MNDQSFKAIIVLIIISVLLVGRSAPNRFRLFEWVANANDEMAKHPFSRRAMMARLIIFFVIGVPMFAIIFFIIFFFPNLLD